MKLAKAVLVVAVVLLPGLANLAAKAAGPYTIKFPCVTPVLTKNSVGGDGFCGKSLTVTGGGHFTVTPVRPADLDVHFYDAAGNALDAFAGPGPGGTGCGAFTNVVPAAAKTAIVVATPSVCVSSPGWAVDGSEINVQFHFTQS